MNFLKRSRLSKVILAVLMVMVLAFALTASAAPGINLIGVSPSQRDATITNQQYGYDPTLPIIMSFDVGVNAGSFEISEPAALTDDITLSLNGVLQDITLLDSGSGLNPGGFALTLNPNDIIVVPTIPLVAGTVYELTYADQVDLTFITKNAGGGGGQQSPRLAVGRIANSTDAGFESVANGVFTVPTNQMFRYAFTNNIPATTETTTGVVHDNADSINMYKWIGADQAPTRATILASSNLNDLNADPNTLTPAFFSDTTNWQPVAITDMFVTTPNAPLRQLVGIVPNALLDANSFYAILIDQTLQSQGGNAANNPQNLQQAVFEFFKTGAGAAVVPAQ